VQRLIGLRGGRRRVTLIGTDASVGADDDERGLPGTDRTGGGVDPDLSLTRFLE
jgi:hypothetical protein